MSTHYLYTWFFLLFICKVGVFALQDDADLATPIHSSHSPGGTDIYFLVDYSGLNATQTNEVSEFVVEATTELVNDGAGVGIVVGQDLVEPLNSQGRRSSTVVRKTFKDFLTSVTLKLDSISTSIFYSLDRLSKSLYFPLKRKTVIIIITSKPVSDRDYAKVMPQVRIFKANKAHFVVLAVGNEHMEVTPFDDITDAPCLVLRYDNVTGLAKYTPKDGHGHYLGHILPVVAQYTDNKAGFESICLELVSTFGYKSHSSNRFNLADPENFIVHKPVAPTSRATIPTTTTSTSTTMTTTTTTPTTTTTTTTPTKTTTTTTTTSPTTTTTTPTTTTTTTTPATTTTTTTLTTTTTTAPTTTTPTTTTTTTLIPETTTTSTTTTTTTTPTTTTATTTVPETTSTTETVPSTTTTEDYSSDEYYYADDQQYYDEDPVTTPKFFETVTSGIEILNVEAMKLYCYQCINCLAEIRQMDLIVPCGNVVPGQPNQPFCYIQRQGSVYQRGCSLYTQIDQITFNTGAFSQQCCNDLTLCNEEMKPLNAAASIIYSALFIKVLLGFLVL